MSAPADDMPESALELPGMDLSKKYRDRAEERGASESAEESQPPAGDDFDRLVNWIQSELQIKSARIVFPGPPIALFHAIFDHEEYMITIVPTKLASEP